MVTINQVDYGILLYLDQSSKIWHKVIKAQRKLVKHTKIIKPTNYEEVLNIHLWWASNYIGGDFGFSLKRSQQLAKK